MSQKTSIYISLAKTMSHDQPELQGRLRKEGRAREKVKGQGYE